MNRKKKTTSITGSVNEHVDTLGELLTQLKTHLTESAGKGTYGDYLRLLDFYCETSGTQAREILVRWVDNDDLSDVRTSLD